MSNQRVRPIPERASCSECRRSMRLTAKGVLGHHGGPRGEYRCPGVGKKPWGKK